MSYYSRRDLDRLHCKIREEDKGNDSGSRLYAAGDRWVSFENIT